MDGCDERATDRVSVRQIRRGALHLSLFGQFCSKHGDALLDLMDQLADVPWDGDKERP